VFGLFVVDQTESGAKGDTPGERRGGSTESKKGAWVPITKNVGGGGEKQTGKVQWATLNPMPNQGVKGKLKEKRKINLDMWGGIVSHPKTYTLSSWPQNS